MKKILTITLLVLLTVGLFVSCDANTVEDLFAYTVTFDMQNHGKQIEPLTKVISGSRIAEPAEPTTKGFIFGGWYREDTCTTEWKFDTDKVTKDTTLYAKWTINSYNVTAQVQGSLGTATVKVNDEEVSTATPGATVKLVATANEGYQFKEWNVVSGGISVTDNKFTMPASNVTVQAVFEAVPETKKLSEILPSGFPTSDDTAWVNADGKKAYKAGDNIKVGNLTLGKDTTVTKSGDNYVCTSGDATVTFKVKDGAEESITVTGSTDSNGTYSPNSECIAAGTMISMPGGKQKAVEELEIGDVICTFDHETGEVSSAPIAFIWESKNVGNAFTLTFEDDIEVTVIEEHGLRDQRIIIYNHISNTAPEV